MVGDQWPHNYRLCGLESSTCACLNCFCEQSLKYCYCMWVFITLLKLLGIYCKHSFANYSLLQQIFELVFKSTLTFAVLNTLSGCETNLYVWLTLPISKAIMSLFILWWQYRVRSSLLKSFWNITGFNTLLSARDFACVVFFLTTTNLPLYLLGVEFRSLFLVHPSILLSKVLLPSKYHASRMYGLFSLCVYVGQSHNGFVSLDLDTN